LLIHQIKAARIALRLDIRRLELAARRMFQPVTLRSND
jgi:hypothetical protein